jgi:transposase
MGGGGARPARRQDNRGRPWHDTRAGLPGILWILGGGAHWSEMPAKYPPYQTCHRRFQKWIRNGKLVEVLGLLARHLHERGKLKSDEAFVDATFASAKKGASLLGRPGAAGHKDRRYRLWRWSSSRRICRERFACRVSPCGGCSGRMLPRAVARTTHR